MKAQVQLYRLSRVADRTVEYETDSLAGPPAAAAALYEFLKDLPNEHVVVAYLNTHLQLVGIETAGMGGINSVGLVPADIFRGAVLAACNAIILAHNHPSGSTEPSEADVELTKKMMEAGEVLGIQVLDHLIITATSVTSMGAGTVTSQINKPKLGDLSMFDTD
jgi:DNA repair protein RadC